MPLLDDVLWFELDKRNILMTEALIAHPLSINLLGQEDKSCLRQSCTNSVKPEITTRFTKYCLKLYIFK